MLDVRAARTNDAPAILALRHAAEDWLASRSIDQWSPGEVPLSTVRLQVSRGEFVVARYPGSSPIVAAMRTIRSDPEIWPDDGDALYVHGLVIDRCHAGTGLGAAMLDHAARSAADAGISRVRLDCAETNPTLRRYYLGQGFTEVGRREFEDGKWFSVTLFEKHLKTWP
ncbi:GNAT family N-acetyltransferase [Rhodococcoides fascians]|uniref:GNAT family N-acetyltransferase n=1 Tax=Rhodococcoides fascians TaxID=1828 RepID=UPI00068E4C28|nr:GNAT family N-acetyltransferase [Rhodococcus fascians]